MSGISFPDRQGECGGCHRILTLLNERTTDGEVTIACPSCPGVAVLPAREPLDRINEGP